MNSTPSLEELTTSFGLTPAEVDTINLWEVVATMMVKQGKLTEDDFGGNGQHVMNVIRKEVNTIIAYMENDSEIVGYVVETAYSKINQGA